MLVSQKKAAVEKEKEKEKKASLSFDVSPTTGDANSDEDLLPGRLTSNSITHCTLFT